MPKDMIIFSISAPPVGIDYFLGTIASSHLFSRIGSHNHRFAVINYAGS